MPSTLPTATRKALPQARRTHTMLIKRMVLYPHMVQATHRVRSNSHYVAYLTFDSIGFYLGTPPYYGPHFFRGHQGPQREFHRTFVYDTTY